MEKGQISGDRRYRHAAQLDGDIQGVGAGAVTDFPAEGHHYLPSKSAGIQTEQNDGDAIFGIVRRDGRVLYG